MTRRPHLRASAPPREKECSRRDAETQRQEVGDLPEGWALTALGDVVAPSKEKVEPSDRPDAPYLSLEHIEQDTGRIAGRGTGADVNSTKAVFHAGDVLYGKLRPYLNKVCIPDFDGICSTDILVFPKALHLEAHYLLRFLMQRSVVEYAHHHSAGVQLPRVSFDTLAELEFPLPPLLEQKRIVAKVEALLARVNAARERLAKAPAILKRFRQSVLAAACSGQLTADWRDDETNRNGDLPSIWQRRAVSDVCDMIVDCPHSTPRWVERGEICLRTTNFKPGFLDLSEVRYVSRETYSARIARLEPASNDVLYSREGGILGIACLFPPNLRACLGQRMMLMRTARKLRPAYLMYVLNSPHTVDTVRELTGGTASPHLNVGDVKAFEVPLPPPDEQDEIVRRVEAMFALADKIETRVQAATARVEKITQAILAKAFRGELVPTEAELARQEGRDYEPASVLLDRIRAERESQATEPKRKLRRMTKPVERCKRQKKVSPTGRKAQRA